MTEMQSKDDFRLSLTYSHGVDFIGSIQNNSKVMVLEIDSEHTDSNFLTEDSFYGALNSAYNLFFVDVNMGETAFTSQIESHILEKLSDCSQSSLIMQCRSKPMTKVFVKDNKKDSIVPLDLCDDALQVNNEEFNNLLSDEFGVPLLIKGIKSNIAGKFLKEPSLGSGNVKFYVEKEFNNRWNLVDYAAAHDDFLSARFLMLHGKWNLNRRNSCRQRTLEIAAEDASVKTMKAILNLALSLPSCNENVPQNSCQKSVIDLALDKKDYEMVTRLLEVAYFPNLDISFALETIDTSEIPEKLRCFTIEREKFRSWISDETNEDEKLQQTDIIDLIEKSNKDGYLKSQQGKCEISKWSLDRKQFKIYAFLQSLRICIDDEKEISDYLEKLTDAEKDELQKCIEKYFVPIPSAHILFLTSKASASNMTDIDAFKKRVENWFSELDKIDEISVILKVLAQYPILEEIIFDEEKSSTIGADVYGSYLEKGVLVLDFETGKICVGAKQQEPREFLGTLAHELTHLAMHQVYKNKCKPYEEDSDDGNRFGQITTDIKGKKERNKKLDGIISSVFEIKEYSNVLDEELIVRVPHILAKYGKEKGTAILSDQAPELFEYYKEKVMPRCDRYIKERNLIKPRNNIELIAPFIEVFDRVKKSIVKFKEPIQIDFLSQENYLIIEAEDTFSTGCSVYQSLQRIPDYSKSCTYLFLRTYQFNETLLNACNTDAINLLVFICDDEIGLTYIENVINNFEIILTTQKSKRIIFIIPHNTKNRFKNKIARGYSEQTDKTYTLNDLTKESQEEFFKMSIKFQGQTISFGDLMDKENTELKKLINSQMLNKLQKNEVEIHCDIPHFRGYDVDYYINRRFCRKVRILRTIFQDDNNDLFAISEAHISALKMNPHQKCSFLEVGEKDISKIKYVVLDNQKAGEQFDQLCTKAEKRNIHLIKDEKGALIWQQSHGSISRLIKYRELENPENIGASFYLEKNDVLSKRLLIIADSAGMGKSSILVHLEKVLKKTWPNSWVIRVELNNYTEVLFEELERRKAAKPGFSGSTSAIEFLLNDLLKSRLKTTLEKELFKHSLFKCSDKTTIMLDGFDEISPNYKEIVLDLLHALKEIGCKLLVTTRPSMGPDLEERLSEFAYTLEPFIEATQKDFLIKFWKKKMCVTNEQEKALDVYASNLNNEFRLSISDKERKFLSIPLQLRMVAEIFQTNTTGTSENWQGCQEFIESYEDGEEPRLGTKIDLSNLYERFMEKKFYEFYCRDKENQDLTKPGRKREADREYNSVKEEHALLSLHRLLSNEDLNKLLNSSDMEKYNKFIEDIKNGENKIGIIDSVIDDKPHFVHLTFAEYLAPIYFAKKMFLNPDIAFQLINNMIINTSPVFIYCLTKEMSKKESEMKDLLQGKILVYYLLLNDYYDFATVLFQSGYEDYPQPDGYLKTQQGKYEILSNSLHNKQFKIYAFLQSRGICIDNEQEVFGYLHSLTNAEKDELQKCIDEYFFPIPSAHVLFLTSKAIASKKTDTEAFKRRVEKWFSELDEIDEISVILKVLAHYPILEAIIFDEERTSTIGADVYGSDLENGTIDFEKGRICVGTKQQEPREFLGTLAHELTHLAMYQVYKNKCKPYEKDSDDGNRFGQITTDIQGKIERNEELDRIIRWVFEIQEYSDVLDEELIVRVPHILAKYGKEKGTAMLSDQAPELFEYYKEKVMPRCDRYIKERNLIKPRNNIKLIIPFIEVFDRVKKSIVKFKEPIQIDFLSQENYLIIEAEDTFSTGCSVYQSLQRIPDYSKSCNYLFLRTDQFNETLLNACNTDAINLLVFICDDEIGLTHIENVINYFEFILETQKYKRIIFIIPHNTKNRFKNKIARGYSKQTDKAYTLNDLTEESQEEFFKMSIKFQGQTIRFSDLMDKENTELKQLIDSQMLNKLQKNEVEIHCDIPHFRVYDVDYYINRRFCRKVKISRTIFEDNDNNDLFAISEAHIDDLTMNPDQKGSFLEVGKKDISEIKLVVLDNQKAGEQFDQLCENVKNRNIHWIKSENGALIWQQSYGSISRLVKYRELENPNNIGASFYLEEYDVLSKRFLIIADSAGMGKSSILVHLETVFKGIWPNSWVIRVELNNYTEVLSEELERRKRRKPGLSGSTNAIKFLLNDLLESRLKTTLEKELFKHSLFKCPDKTTIMLDGFDEISPNYKEIVLDLLHALKETGCKLLVTTRPSMGPDLEERLNEFAYTLEPFTEATQKKFLITFWKKKLCETNEQEKALDVYASKLNKKFRLSISDKERKFLGIPLQLRMVAEIFQKNTTGTSEDWQGCQEFIESYKDGEEPRLGTKIDLPNLYERFMEKKFYEFYCRDKINLDFTKSGIKEMADQNYNSVKEEHALLSLHRLLNNEDLNKLLNSSDMEIINRCIEDIKNGKNKIGIIDSMIDDKPHFVHPTFAEYLAHIYFMKKMFLNPDIAFQLINNIIINTSPVFIYCLTKEMPKKESEMKDLLQGKTLVNFLILSGYYDFAAVLLESGYEDYPQPDIHNETPLHYSVKSGNLKLVRIVLNRYYHKKNILKHDELKYWYTDSELVKFVNQRDRDNKTAIFYAAKIACEQESKEYMEITCELLRRGADDNEIKEYIKSIKLDPNYAKAYYSRGNAQYGLRKYNKAIEDYTNAIELDPTNAKAYYNRGLAHKNLGKYIEAIADYTKAIRLDPDAKTYFNRGIAHKNLEKYNEAIADYTKAIELDPKYTIAYDDRGIARYELGEYNKAIEDFALSIKLDPSYASSYYDRGNAQLELGRFDDAIRDYTEFMKLNPYDRGISTDQSDQRNEKVKPTYEFYMEWNSLYALAYNNSEVSIGKSRKYNINFPKNIELNPSNVFAYNNRGVAYGKLGLYDQAVADFTEAIKLNPSCPLFYNNRGTIQTELKKYNEALADYTKAIELEREFELAINNRKILMNKFQKIEHGL